MHPSFFSIFINEMSKFLKNLGFCLKCKEKQNAIILFTTEYRRIYKIFKWRKCNILRKILAQFDGRNTCQKSWDHVYHHIESPLLLTVTEMPDSSLFGSCLYMVSSLHDKPLTCISGWQRELCSHTVNCTLSPIQTANPRVWELQTGRHIFWISGEKWGRKWKSDAVFPIFAGWGLTTGLSPSVTLRSHQWNLNTGSADDEKYERKTQYAVVPHTAIQRTHAVKHTHTRTVRVSSGNHKHSHPQMLF